METLISQENSMCFGVESQLALRESTGIPRGLKWFSQTRCF